jgi:hypothetical protein
MPDPWAIPNIPGAAQQLTVESASTGRVMVASDGLLGELDALGRLAEQLRLCAGAVLDIIESLEPRASIAAPVPPAATLARRETTAALGMMLRAQNSAQHIASSVRHCLTEYTEAEQFAQALAHRLGESFAWDIGAGARMFALPLALGLGLGVLVDSRLTGQSPAQLAKSLQTYLRLHGRILTNPTTVAVVRELAADADGLGAGFLLVPPPAAALAESTGFTGVSPSSNSVVAIGRAVGLFEPTGVSVRKTSAFEYGTPPTSLANRSQSFPLPGTAPNGEQIRIDRYVEPGKPDRFDVYIAGTQTFDPKTGDQPFDFTSDLNGVGGRPSASYTAVVEAMRQAGVTSSSPVVLNGYSQGGLLASQIAASGDFDVHGVVTFGAPSAQVHIPASIPVLTVRNTEDLVPATSGYDVNPNAVIVERSAFGSGPIPSEWAVPAHELTTYQHTAAVVDDSTSSAVRDVLDPLNRFGSGAQRVDSTLWVATRVPEASGGR